MRMLYRLLGNEADAMDAFQDCFCRLAVRGEALGVMEKRAYLYRTAGNIAIEMLRSRHRRAAHQKPLATFQAMSRNPESTMIEPDNRESALRTAIARLPPHLRNVILLRDLSSFSYQEVAKMLGIDPATARVYRRHAVVKLAEWLTPGESI